MKLNLSFKQTVGFLLAASFITIFILYCSGRVGIFLLLALILSPAFSVLITFLCKKKLTLKSSLTHDIMSKGEHCTLTVTLQNSSVFPCPPIRLIIKDSPHVSADNGDVEYGYKTVYLTVLPKRSSNAAVTFTAKLAGGSFIGCEKALLKDYFGICTFEIMCESSADSPLYKVGVIPDIAQSGYDNDLLLSAHDAFASGSSEDTIDETALFFGGFPGYEYREYIPGDSLKRINSKLSAKRDKLMVRLDEKQSISNITVILYPYMKESDALLSQTTLEECLGIVFSLLSLDLSVTFYYMQNKLWIAETIYSEDTLILLSKKLAYHIFETEDTAALPDQKEVQNAASLILCRSCDSDISVKAAESLHIYTVSSGEWRHP